MNSVENRCGLAFYSRRLAAALFLASLIVTVIYALWGEPFIKSIYDGRSIGFLNDLIKSQHVHPLSHYISIGNHLIIMPWTMAIIVGILAVSINRLPIAFRLLALLLTIDTLLLVASLFLGRIFDVAKDLGIPELFQYGKELLLATLLMGIYRTNRRLFFLNLSILFLVMLINDATEINAYIAYVTAEFFKLSPILEANHLGDVYTQLITYAVFGGVFVVTYFTNSDREYTRIYRKYAVLLMLLAFFGIVLDGISEMTVGDLFNTAENFGEMVAMSLLLAFTMFIKKGILGKGAQQQPEEHQ